MKHFNEYPCMRDSTKNARNSRDKTLILQDQNSKLEERVCKIQMLTAPTNQQVNPLFQLVPTTERNFTKEV